MTDPGCYSIWPAGVPSGWPSSVDGIAATLSKNFRRTSSPVPEKWSPGFAPLFAPGKQENQRNPTATILFQLLSEAVKNSGKLERKHDASYLVHRWVLAKSGRRSYKIFPATQRTDSVDAATLVFEKWARNAGVEVVNRQLRECLLVRHPSITENFLDNTRVAQCQQSTMKASFEFRTPLLG